MGWIQVGDDVELEHHTSSPHKLQAAGRVKIVKSSIAVPGRLSWIE